MKKSISLLLSLLMIVTGTTGYAFASEPDAVGVDDMSEAKLYAYLDIEKAPESLREKILKARQAIIFSESWSADGYECYIVDVASGDKIEKLPEFSEIFPDWDAPVLDTESEFNPDWVIPEYIHPDVDAYVPGWDVSNSPTRRVFYGSVYLNTPPADTLTDPFFTFNTQGIETLAYASTLYSSQYYNLGFSNTSTGASLG